MAPDPRGPGDGGAGPPGEDHLQLSHQLCGAPAVSSRPVIFNSVLTVYRLFSSFYTYKYG